MAARHGRRRGVSAACTGSARRPSGRCWEAGCGGSGRGPQGGSGLGGSGAGLGGWGEGAVPWPGREILGVLFISYFGPSVVLHLLTSPGFFAWVYGPDLAAAHDAVATARRAIWAATFSFPPAIAAILLL